MKIDIFLAHPDAKLPMRASAEAAGWDLYSIDAGELWPEDTKTFSTGLIIRPPEGYHIKVYGRSGWGLKYGVGIPHGVGVCDRDFCGPDDIYKVILHRTCGAGRGSRDHAKALVIEKGDRIAQMVLEKTNEIEFNILDHPPSEISRGGWGHSGVK